MKTKGEGWKRKLRTQGILALRGASDRCTGGLAQMRGGTPRGCFCKRVWICLIAKDLTFLAATKSLQQYEPSRVKAL